MLKSFDLLGQTAENDQLFFISTFYFLIILGQEFENYFLTLIFFNTKLLYHGFLTLIFLIFGFNNKNSFIYFDNSIIVSAV